jgi:hypothetical protein
MFHAGSDGGRFTPFRDETDGLMRDGEAPSYSRNSEDDTCQFNLVVRGSTKNMPESA